MESKNIQIKVKYLKEVEKIEKIDIGDWIDLRAGEDVEIKAGEYKAIPLGIAINLPEGYEALVVPRSSTFKRHGIIQTNSTGVIDNSYLGEWHMPVLAMQDTIIHKNDRICQFRIIENQPTVDIVEVDNFDDVESNRGTRGFGSTGIN